MTIPAHHWLIALALGLTGWLTLGGVFVAALVVGGGL